MLQDLIVGVASSCRVGKPLHSLQWCDTWFQPGHDIVIIAVNYSFIRLVIDLFKLWDFALKFCVPFAKRIEMCMPFFLKQSFALMEFMIR